MNRDDPRDASPGGSIGCEVYEASLGLEEFDALSADLQACAQVLSVTTRKSRREPSGPPPSPISIGDAFDSLRRGADRSIQVRYRFEESEWVDTLFAADGGFRLVRSRQP